MDTDTARPVVVRVDGVSKNFTIKKTKSVKERVLNPRRSAAHNETFTALHNISLDIEAGSTIGLIGPNGSGKSTLLKAIGGIIQPTRGTVSRRGSMAALLELGAGFHPDLTGRENVYLNAAILGLTREQTDGHFDEIVEFSGIGEFIDTQVKFYSSGMYVRLAFAVAIHVDPDVLLVDEVLAVGDEAFQKKCLDKIREFQLEGRTIILVTHTLSQITDLCTRAVVLAKGSVVFDGDPVDAVGLLRSGFATGRDDAAARKDAAAIESLETGRIRRVALRTVDGEPLDELEHGGDLVVEIEVDSKRGLDTWAMGIQVSTALGQMVTATSTGRMKVRPKPLREPVTARFVLPGLTLGTGDYKVEVALHGTSGKELDRWAEPPVFSVRADTRTQGPLYSPATLEIH
jgi:ABC-2 type transport system ATP-binding protein